MHIRPSRYLAFVPLLFASFLPGTGLAQPQGALVYAKNGDAWIMNPDGSSQTRLTETGDVSFPRLANSVLLFKRAGQIYRTTLQGFAVQTAPQAVPNTAGVLEFDQSPDGGRIVLTYGSNFTLYTMNADGTGLAAINSTANLHQGTIAWGRDGFIYLVQSSLGNAFSQTIYRIPENGINNPVQLTNYFSQFPAAAGPAGRIAFLYNHPVKYLRTMNPDGSAPADVPGVDAGDGGYIGIDHFDDAIYYPRFDQIWRVRADGSGNQMLVSGAFPGFVDYGTLTPADQTAPLVTSVTPQPNPAPKGTPVTLTAAFTDAGGSGLALAQYTVDGGAPLMMASLSGTAASASIGLAAFPQAGVHSLCVRAQDLAGNIGQFQCALLAVYDPEAGFVTGGGWLRTSAGKSEFGLEAKYKKGSTVPSGQLEFHAGDGLKFKSAGLGWLVITGETAVLRGAGILNGVAGHQFELTVEDRSAGDRLGLRIWNGAGTVFETAPAALGGGQIVIH